MRNQSRPQFAAAVRMAAALARGCGLPSHYSFLSLLSENCPFAIFFALTRFDTTSPAMLPCYDTLIKNSLRLGAVSRRGVP